MAVKESIMQITPYKGGDAQLPGEGPIYRMASNESALGPSPRAMQAFIADSTELHRYPDGAAFHLRQALGDKFSLPIDNIVCGAGSDELIHLLAQAYTAPGDEILFSRHGFLVYRIAAQINGAIPVEAAEKNLCTDIDALLKLVTPYTRLVFIANPNNPTGSYLSAKTIAQLRQSLPKDVLLIIDAAYAEYAYAPDYESGIELAKQHDNIVVLRTFSKIYGLAGLRVGWAYCPASVADVLNRIRGPFNVSAPAQAAAIAALKDKEHLKKAHDHNKYWLDWFSNRLKTIGLKFYPSQGNFILIQFPEDPALNADAAADFLNKHRILPRKMNAYHLPQCLRITIAEEEAVRKAAEVLELFVQQASNQ